MCLPNRPRINSEPRTRGPKKHNGDGQAAVRRRAIPSPPRVGDTPPVRPLAPCSGCRRGQALPPVERWKVDDVGDGEAAAAAAAGALPSGWRGWSWATATSIAADRGH